jgi:tryptophan synthase
MSVTGDTTGTLNADLPNLLERVHTYSGGVPAAVGFGFRSREHYLSIANIAEGVVIGSQIIRELSQAAPGEEGQAVEKYCRMITDNDGSSNHFTREVGIVETLAEAREPDGSLIQADKVITAIETTEHTNDLVDQLNTDPTDSIPMRFGEYGGQYVPEALVDCLAELDKGFQSAVNDPKFWEEFRSYYPYMGRPSPLQFANRLTEHIGTGKIYLKREDLLHTGSHKINNAIGQILLARRLGKTEIIAETGAGQVSPTEVEHKPEINEHC